jgi:hypothetical protein
MICDRNAAFPAGVSSQGVSRAATSGGKLAMKLSAIRPIRGSSALACINSSFAARSSSDDAPTGASPLASPFHSPQQESSASGI